jgi:outer membrane murein-binding lipoprotein Lpp
MPAWPAIVVAGGALLAGLVVLAATQLRRMARLASRVALLESRSDALRRDLEAVGAGSLAALERLDAVEPALERLADRLGPLELGSAGRSYDLAIEAASRGAARDDLVSRFGLSPGEADLVLALHRPRPGGR